MEQRLVLTARDGLRFVDLPGRRSADPFADHDDLDVSVRFVRLRRGPARTPHRHPYSSEVVHVLAGEGEAWLEGRRRPVRAGDTFVVPRAAAHATLPAPGSTMELLCFFPRPDLASNLEELDGPELF